KRAKRDYDSGRVSTAAARRRRTPMLLIGAIVLVAIIAAGILCFPALRDRMLGRASSNIEAIAVLPFANATQDSRLEYLSDGLTESLIGGLAELRQIRVMAPGTVFAYKGRTVDPKAVGRELNVAAVVQGRVNRQGDTLAIQIDLVKTSDGTELWGQ